MEIVRIPILKIEDFLVAAVQRALHEVRAMDLKDALPQRICEAKGVVLDLSPIDVLASFVGRLFNDSWRIFQRMGANVDITGRQPAVAITPVELGLELPRVLTALNLEEGFAVLRREAKLAAHG